MTIYEPLLSSFRKVAKELPAKSWNLHPTTAQAMVRHQVAEYDHTTCMVSLTEEGQRLLGGL